MADLKTRQTLAIAALLAGKSRAEAAQAAGCGLRTLDRWLADSGFRAALAQAESELINQASRRLANMTERALQQLENIFESGNVNPQITLQAIKLVLTEVLHFREVANLEERIAALEATQDK